MQIPLIKGDKAASNVEYRDALPVNMFAVPRDILGAKGYMLQWYGLTEFTQGEGVDRGARWVTAQGFKGQYRVSGTSFIKVNSDKTTTILGTVPAGGQSSIAFSFNNIAVVSGGNLYYYNPSDGFRQITDAQIGSPIDIVWADGLFVLTDGVDLYHSDPLDEESYLAADFGNAQFRPDLTNGLGLNEDNELIAFGVTSTEYFTNQGAENFVYFRIQLKAVKIGILGTHCRKEMNGRWYLLGRREESSPAIYAGQGGGFEVISTREIEQVLYSCSQEALAITVVDAFSRDKMNFVQINLPNETLIFNETAAKMFGVDYAWSIIKSDVLGNLPFRGINYCLDSESSKWICGDRLNASVGVLDETVGTQYGEIAEWSLFTPFVKLESLTVSQIEIDIVPGFTAAEDDATVFVSSTQDGVIYSNEATAEYGDQFDYEDRFILRPEDYVRNYISYKLRGATRSRVCFSKFEIEAS